MKIYDLHNKRILIAGYGIEGKTTEKFLKTFVPGSSIAITDAQNGPDYLAQQSEYDLVIRTPGIPLHEITIEHTTATNIFFANLDPRHMTIGVTGSKGKSTTSSLIHHILKSVGKSVKLIGNIGQPMLEELIHPPKEPNIYVLELSSYQLEDIQYSPHISVIVSLFPDHIPHHGSIENYYEAKHQIISQATIRDFFVYNPSFPSLSQWAEETQARTIPYRSYAIPENVKLLGDHNVQNMRAAMTVAEILEIPLVSANTALTTFEPLPHRLQHVGSFHGIDFYDDAISTTPESTVAALDALKNVETIFLGGEDRGYDFAILADRLKESSVKNVVLFPDSGVRIGQSIENLGLKYSLLETRSMEDAVKFAYEHTEKGAICLLSCASPSYSLWKNFIEKGDEFQKFVKSYAKTK